MKYRTPAVIVIFICLSASLPVSGVERTVERTFDVKQGGTLFLDSDTGSVDITSHSENSVIVNVSLQTRTSNESKAESIFEDFELTFDQRDKDVTVKGEYIHNTFWHNNRLKVHFDVKVPHRYNLEIDTAGGRINVDDIQGRVDLETSGGNINMGNISGEVQANTSGGSISLESSSGDTYVKTSGGNIRIGSVEGNIEAKTSGGSIEVDGVNGNLHASTSGGNLHLGNIDGNLTGRTSGGTITAELKSQVRDRVELRSSGGSIRLAVPADFNANLDASTSGGHVYTDLPVKVKGRISNSSLNGILNNGGPELVLKTSGGSIEIRESSN